MLSGRPPVAKMSLLSSFSKLHARVCISMQLDSSKGMYVQPLKKQYKCTAMSSLKTATHTLVAPLVRWGLSVYIGYVPVCLNVCDQLVSFWAPRTRNALTLGIESSSVVKTYPVRQPFFCCLWGYLYVQCSTFTGSKCNDLALSHWNMPALLYPALYYFGSR